MERSSHTIPILPVYTQRWNVQEADILQQTSRAGPSTATVCDRQNEPRQYRSRNCALHRHRAAAPTSFPLQWDYQSGPPREQASNRTERGNQSWLDAASDLDSITAHDISGLIKGIRLTDDERRYLSTTHQERVSEKQAERSTGKPQGAPRDEPVASAKGTAGEDDYDEDFARWAMGLLDGFTATL